MKKFLRKLNERRTAFFVCMGIYLAFWFISLTALEKLWTFEWAAQSRYCYTWVVALIFIAFKNTLPAYFITFGSVAGTVIGQFLGDYIIKQNLSRAAS